jgi:hypothetical protein
MSRPKPPASKSVFINCPFDKSYQPFFQAIVFAVCDCGFAPRCALEIQDASQTRIDKIFRMISECKYGIHDICRTEPDPVTHLPRFNMPLELGIFLGAKHFGDDKQNLKVCLILDKDRFRYQSFISDIAGQDITAHLDSEEELLKVVRDFLRNASRRKTIPGHLEILGRYTRFKVELPAICARLGHNPASLNYNDYSTIVSEWLLSLP